MHILFASELVNQVSTHGSDYIYSYVAMGELYGFLIGWNLILEYCLDFASVCKALTDHIDIIYFGGGINSWEEKTTEIPTEYFSDYIDFFSVACCLILTMVVAMGGKLSTVVSNFLTCFNLVCYVSIIVFGSFSCDISYWYVKTATSNQTFQGDTASPDAARPAVGFMPFGMRGVFEGAGSCIFAFAGFRAIYAEGVNSRISVKSVPIASISTLVISCVLYIGVSFVVSLMISATQIDTAAPIFSVFREHDLVPLQNLLAIGAITGMLFSRQFTQI